MVIENKIERQSVGLLCTLESEHVKVRVIQRVQEPKKRLSEQDRKKELRALRGEFWQPRYKQ